MTRGRSILRLSLGVALLAAVAVGAPRGAVAQHLPEIRTHARNKVPACVTPPRLMRFLKAQNSRLLPKFETIADWYKKHGEANKVRWDYAFFQMLLETNYLKFKNAAGQGDVDPRQNNFAGIGTTGGGVPGDSFPDVSTGVLGQMQHLVAYSGERVEDPVARRTREKQDEIIQRSRMLGRPVTFKDLTRRWAADHRYGSAIAFVASRFDAEFCNGRGEPDADEADTPPPTTAEDGDEAPKARRGRGKSRGKAARPPADDEERTEDAKPDGRGLARGAIDRERGNDDDRSIRAGLGVPDLVQGPRAVGPPTGCRVFTASYGGERNVLIRARIDNELHYTALQVLDGQEERLARAFIASHAKGGDRIGDFANRQQALSRAFALCPSAETRASAGAAAQGSTAGAAEAGKPGDQPARN